MPTSSNTTNRDAQVTETEIVNKPEFVYCKGCGTQLESRARLQKTRGVVDALMCKPCQERHGHSLMPMPGAPTYCYRCGTLEEVVLEPATPPVTHHICPQCLPDRLERYLAGDFSDPKKLAAEAEAAEAKAAAAAAKAAATTTST